MSFENRSKKQFWTEEQCRNMLNAALLHLAEQAGGQLVIRTEDLLNAAERGGGVAMALSDDDSTLTITALRKT